MYFYNMYLYNFVTLRVISYIIIKFVHTSSSLRYEQVTSFQSLKGKRVILRNHCQTLDCYHTAHTGRKQS